MGTRGCIFALGVSKVDIVCNYFRRPALIAVLIGLAADLQSAGYNGHTAPGKVLADKLTGLTPGDTVDKIDLLVTSVG